MSNPINRDRPRTIEVRFRNVPEGVSLRDAERFQRSSCDGFLIVQKYLDEPSPESKGIASYVTASMDSETGREMSVGEMYRIWVSIAGAIVNSEEESDEAIRIRKFCMMMLHRLELNDKLGRLEQLKKDNPDVPEQELAAQMLAAESGAVPTSDEPPRDVEELIRSVGIDPSGDSN